MKKFVKSVVGFMLAAILACGAGCSGKSPEKALIGSWYTEQNGVRLTVSFSKDGTMTTVCNITDKAAADAAGVNPDIVNTKNIGCLYKVEAEPDISALTSEEQELLKGKSAIVSFLTDDDVKNNLPGETIYFNVSDNTLVTVQRNGTFNSSTDVPEYSETVFTKNK